MTRILFLWQEFCSCGRNFVLVTKILSFWWEFSSCDRNSISMTKQMYLKGHLLLWLEVYCRHFFLRVYSSGFCSFDRQFILGLFIHFLWQEFYSGKINFIPLILRTQHIFATKSGPSNKDFVWGFKISCQPGWQVDRDYPTLVNFQ